MHHILEQMKSVMQFADAFENETLKRFRLKLVRHGRDMGAENEEYLYSLVDKESEDLGCRVMISNAEAWFEVFYEDNNEQGDRAYSVVVGYRPAIRQYELEVMVTPRGAEEVAAVLTPEFEAKDQKRIVTADQYHLLVASMSLRFSQKLRQGLS